MTVDQSTLADVVQILHRRWEDLGRIRSFQTRNADVARWQCAKADRYRAAMAAREQQMIMIQQKMADLAQTMNVAARLVHEQDQATSDVLRNL